jgi:hypothetical protein
MLSNEGIDLIRMRKIDQMASPINHLVRVDAFDGDNLIGIAMDMEDGAGQSGGGSPVEDHSADASQLWHGDIPTHSLDQITLVVVYVFQGGKQTTTDDGSFLQQSVGNHTRDPLHQAVMRRNAQAIPATGDENHRPRIAHAGHFKGQHAPEGDPADDAWTGEIDRISNTGGVIGEPLGGPGHDQVWDFKLQAGASLRLKQAFVRSHARNEYKSLAFHRNPRHVMDSFQFAVCAWLGGLV